MVAVQAGKEMYDEATGLPLPYAGTRVRRAQGPGCRYRADWNTCDLYTALIFQAMEVQASLAYRKYPASRPLELQKGLRTARDSRIIALANCLTGVWEQTVYRIATPLKARYEPTHAV